MFLTNSKSWDYLTLMLIGLGLFWCFYQLFFDIDSGRLVYYLALAWAFFFLLAFKGTVFDSFINGPGSLILWLVIIGFAIAFRVMAFTAEPYLADDFQRYLFDGRIQLAGFNPYSVVPLELNEWGGDLIPKPEVKTIYPPMAQVIFKLSAWFGDSLLHWKFFSLLPDLLGAVVFIGILKVFDLSPLWVIFWLWNPLIIKEISHAAHLDIWTLFALVLYLYTALMQRLRLAAFFLALAVLIKLIPLLILPAWLYQLYRENLHGKPLILLQILLIFLFTLLVGFLAYFPEHPFSTIAYFYQHIQGYGALFLLGTSIFPEDNVKVLLTCFAGAIILFMIFIQGRYQHHTVLNLSELFFVIFLFSSMGFPWYLILCLPWIIVKKDWLLMTFVALTQLNFYAHQIAQPAEQFLVILLLLSGYWFFKQFREVKYETIY